MTGCHITNPGYTNLVQPHSEFADESRARILELEDNLES